MNGWEIAGIVGTIGGTVVAYLGYKASTSYKETRKIALEKFDFSKKLNDRLLFDLYDFGKRTKSFQKIFMNGLTLKQGIAILEKAGKEILNKEYRLTLTHSKSKMRLDEIIKHLDIQIKHQSEVRTHFDFFVNKAE